MFDPLGVTLSYLATRPRLNGVRLIGGSAFPNGYRIENGPCILVQPRPTNGLHYSNAAMTTSMQFRSFAATDAQAMDVDGALFDSLNDQSAPPLIFARLELTPNLLRDPETQWPFVLSFYVVRVRPQPPA